MATPVQQSLRVLRPLSSQLLRKIRAADQTCLQSAAVASPAGSNCRHFSSTIPRWKARLIDGKAMAKDIKSEVKAEVDEMVAAGKRPPHLTAIIVGDDPASHTYVRNKMKACEETGISSKTLKLDASISQEELLKLIQQNNEDDSVMGFLFNSPSHLTLQKEPSVML